MFWTLELASHLEDAPWPATKDELIDYAIRSGAPLEVVENLQELDDEGEIYEGIEDISATKGVKTSMKTFVGHYEAKIVVMLDDLSYSPAATDRVLSVIAERIKKAKK